ncbi:LysR family transcriptional regulator [Puniceibacterium confluentis]|uniref:LysR family transcriptional regulator n=1 Tax=Puniceibacterium confluentis TaxID=1958944 RepID=UPI0011B62364|nr:LysR family transcriptional regulator [Puniceibacterium confluentis]
MTRQNDPHTEGGAATMTNGPREPFEKLPNLRHLKALLHVGALRSVNRAGAEMNLSQPAVTQAIARLEKAFGAAFFVRHPTGMYPTDAGEIMLRRVARVFDALRAGLIHMPNGTAEQSPDLLLKSVQIEALSAISRAPTQDAAAQITGTTVAAMARNLNTLERRLGLRLMFRDGDQLRLSEAGALLARAAKLSQRELELARDELNDAAGLHSGRLSVGALPMARTYITPKALIATGMAFPDVRVQMVEGAYETLLAALRDGDIDYIVGTLREPAPTPDVVETPLFSDRLCVVARSGHPLAGHARPGLDAFLKFPWIAPREGSPARREFEMIFPACGQKPSQIYEVASHMAVRAILRESDTLALISRHQIKYEEEDGQLMVLSETLASTTRVIGYTARVKSAPTRPQQYFLAELARAAEFSRRPEASPPVHPESDAPGQTALQS